MRQIRFGTFETNSSSTHSLVIGTPEQIEKWENCSFIIMMTMQQNSRQKKNLTRWRKLRNIFPEKIGRMEKNGTKQQNISTTILKLSQRPVENNFQLFVLMVEMANY